MKKEFNVMTDTIVTIVAPFTQYCEVYYDNCLVAYFETDDYSHIDDVIQDFLIALNDLSACENKEDFATAKATIKRLKERDFEMRYSLYSDIEDMLFIELTKEEVEIYF